MIPASDIHQCLLPAVHYQLAQLRAITDIRSLLVQPSRCNRAAAVGFRQGERSVLSGTRAIATDKSCPPFT